jgi:hypothetical protein
VAEPVSERALTDADVDAVARRVVELLEETATPSVVHLDTATVARMYNVRPEWVRAHAAELGGVRVGDSRKGQLRFHVDRVAAAMERRRVPAAAPAPAGPRRPGPKRGSRSVRLLPLPDDAAA